MAKVSTEKGAKRRPAIKNLVYTALYTAILAVLSQIAFPLPSGIPVTLQTFAVAAIGYFGGIWGVAAVFIYLLLGVVGAPVFSSFRGGFYALIGVTGGYLIGFLPMALCCALPTRSLSGAKKAAVKIAFGLLGLFLCHLFGALWFGYTSGSGVERAFIVASAPYLLKDVFSLVGGYLFAELLHKRVKTTL